MPGIILGDGYTEGNKIVKVFDSWTLHPWGKMETKKENKQIIQLQVAISAMKKEQKQNNMKDGASPAGKDGDFENVDASVSGHT